MKYKHIVWDWNGTLLDDTWLCHGLCDLQFRTLGHPGVSFENYTRECCHPLGGFQHRDRLVKLGVPTCDDLTQIIEHL